MGYRPDTIVSSLAEPSRQVTEAASWRLAVELLRHAPERFKLIETHPADGTYDCLSLLDQDPNSPVRIIHLNRPGSVTVFPRDPNEDWWRWERVWSAFLHSPDPRRIVRKIARAVLIPVGSGLPPSTRPVLTVRVIAGLLSATAFSRTRWEGRQPLGYRSDPDQLFAPFRTASQRLKVSEPSDLEGEPRYRFWFLLRNEDPMLAFETMTSKVWDLEGNEYDLMSIYREEGDHIWPVICRVTRNLDLG